MRAAFYTFGCKLNQFETEALASSFRSQGFSLVSVREEAEYYIINTCTVTSKSEQKARRLIRKLSRRTSESLLIVTGCYAQLNREVLESLGDNIVVVSQDKKNILMDLPGFLTGDAGLPDNKLKSFGMFSSIAEVSPHGQFSFKVDKYSFHSRAFLKIQDGCDYRCAYCRIPLARGRSVSLDPDTVVARLKKLESSGYREVVLTGVNIASYSYKDISLPGLLARVLEGVSRLRFRLSSLEPEMIDHELGDVLRKEEICPHFHIPVQSGSNKVLRHMQRRHRADEVINAVNLLKQVKPGSFIAADLLVGFPGETDEDFMLTRNLVQELEFSRLHVFPFSPRPGTEAYTMKDRVPERIRDERVKELLILSNELYTRYAGTWFNRKVQVILEYRQAEPQEGLWIGHSGNYLKILVSDLPLTLAQSGLPVNVIIDSIGEICQGHCVSA